MNSAVKTAVVTGAGGAIGAAIAEALHQDGWQVIGMDRQFTDAGEQASNLCEAVVVDIADDQAFRNKLETLLQSYEIECLVNCGA